MGAILICGALLVALIAFLFPSSWPRDVGVTTKSFKHHPPPLPPPPRSGGHDILKSFDFLEAVYHQDHEAVRGYLASDDVDVNYSSGKGCAFYLAVQNDDIEMLRLLLSHPQANPNGKGSSWTPLLTAIYRRQQEILDGRVYPYIRGEEMVKLIIAHPKAHLEVLGESLNCEVVEWLPANISIVSDRECFGDHRVDMPPISSSSSRTTSLAATPHWAEPVVNWLASAKARDFGQSLMLCIYVITTALIVGGTLGAYIFRKRR